MKKHALYLRYLLRHKWYVFVAGRRIGVSAWRLIIHDWSKFLPSEWRPYVAYFYGPKPDKKEPDDYLYWNAVSAHRIPFDRAWLHHQHLNPHHWQHWILRSDDGAVDALEMPHRFTLEMVADWSGAGRAITGRWDVSDWYEKNKNKMILHRKTRTLVEAVLKCMTSNI